MNTWQSGQHQTGEDNSEDQDGKVRSVASGILEDELPQAGRQGLPKDYMTNSQCQAAIRQLQWRQGRTPGGIFGLKELIPKGSHGASTYSSIRLCKDLLSSLFSAQSLSQSSSPV